MLEARDISVSYDKCDAVRNVSLRAAPCEMTAIVGPNGAGKSTLIRALNGSLPISRGEILLDDKPLRSYARRYVGRRIAVVAQEAELRFPFTVMEFVLGGRFAWSDAGAWGWETTRDIEAAREALRETGLENFHARRMDKLSGGERQRAVLARALATEADVLLLDEPTANLDLAHQAAMLKLLRARCDQRKAAAIFVTHDLNLAAEFTDHMLLLKFGQTLAVGATRDVLKPEILREAFAVRVIVDAHPLSKSLRVTPVYESEETH
jgi:iron complex transport system ATP-binding protein